LDVLESLGDRKEDEIGEGGDVTDDFDENV